MFRLLDEVEEQEFREAILAYALLTETNAPTGRTLAELDSEAEELLLAATDMDIDFEAHDAIEKLVRLGLVTLTAGRYQAVSIPAALLRLGSMWDSLSVLGNATKNRAA